MSKRSSLMEAAKQNKKKTAIIAVVVVLVLAALFMRFKGGSKGGSGGGRGRSMQDTQMDNVATVAAENPKERNNRADNQHIRYCRGIGRCLCLCEGIRRCDGCQRQRR